MCPLLKIEVSHYGYQVILPKKEQLDSKAIFSSNLEPCYFGPLYYFIRLNVSSKSFSHDVLSLDNSPTLTMILPSSEIVQVNRCENPKVFLHHFNWLSLNETSHFLETFRSPK